MKTAASVVSLVAVFLFARLLSGATEGRTAVVSEFVGTSPCGAGPRAFLGGMAPTAACHAITWRLTLVTDGNGPSAWKVAATYGIPARGNPNQMVDGPKVAIEGTVQARKGTRSNTAAIVYHLKTDGPGRSLDLAHVGDDLLQFLADDRSLMVGNAGWSYTLNRANRAEKTGNDAGAPDMSYVISPRSTGPVFGVFEGRTPCRGISRELNLPEVVGCFKVKWRVTLHQNPQTSAPTTYKVESSLHRQRAREGTWSIVRGEASHPGDVYRLSATGTEKALLLLKGDDNVLFFLDEQPRLLIGNADFSYTLNRVTASAGPSRFLLNGRSRTADRGPDGRCALLRTAYNHRAPCPFPTVPGSVVTKS